MRNTLGLDFEGLTWQSQIEVVHCFSFILSLEGQMRQVILVMVLLMMFLMPTAGQASSRNGGEGPEAVVRVMPKTNITTYSAWLYVDRRGRVQDVQAFTESGESLEPHWKITAEIKDAFSKWIFKPALDRYNRPCDSIIEFRAGDMK